MADNKNNKNKTGKPKRDLDYHLGDNKKLYTSGPYVHPQAVEQSQEHQKKKSTENTQTEVKGVKEASTKETDSEQQKEQERKEPQEGAGEEINNSKQEPAKQRHITLTEVSQQSKLEKATIKDFKIKCFFAVLVLFLAGFLMGKYYETSTRNTVYVLDEAKFLKLASIGIATADKDKTTSELSRDDKERVRAAIREVNEILANQYSRYPVLIQKRNKDGFDVYGSARRIDITVPLLIQLIGEDKWKEIGKVLK